MTSASAQTCMASFTAALLSRDINAALDLLDDKALLFYSNGSVLTKTSFASVMTAAWQVVENYVYSSTEPTWLVDGEAAAVAVYGFEWSGVARGQPVSGSGRATRAFVKRNGGWLLAHEHLSAGSAPS